jgi:hypothetical protein
MEEQRERERQVRLEQEHLRRRTMVKEWLRRKVHTMHVQRYPHLYTPLGRRKDTLPPPGDHTLPATGDHTVEVHAPPDADVGHGAVGHVEQDDSRPLSSPRLTQGDGVVEEGEPGDAPARPPEQAAPTQPSPATDTMTSPPSVFARNMSSAMARSPQESAASTIQVRDWGWRARRSAHAGIAGSDRVLPLSHVLSIVDVVACGDASAVLPSTTRRLGGH